MISAAAASPLLLVLTVWSATSVIIGQYWVVVVLAVAVIVNTSIQDEFEINCNLLSVLCLRVVTSLVTAGFYMCGLEILRVRRNHILEYWIWLTCCYTIDQWKEASILQMCIGSRYQHTTVGSHTPVTTLYADLDWCDTVRMCTVCSMTRAWPR